MRKTEQNKLNKTRVQQTGENGITLVSLVITIIVLLVLAGVAINMAINSEGLFGKANEATEEWNTAVGQEETTINNWIGKLEEMTLTPEPMITKWNIAAGDTVRICLYRMSNDSYDKDGNWIEIELPNNTDVTINWGDGTEEHYTSSNLQHVSDIFSIDSGYIEHTYTENNSNNIVTINGKCNAISMWNNSQLTSIEQWGYTETYVYNFNECENLANIASPGRYTFKNVTDFISTFEDCTGITSIPEDLFANCSNATDFSSTFWGCTGITSIPEDLFANCSNATDFNSTFWGCTVITSIPENLFANCSNATDFDSTFEDCAGITSIPEDLFANCSNATDFSSTFSGTGITSIPEGLFANCSNVTDFSYTFADCTSLTGNPIPLWERVPDGANNGYEGVPDGYGCYYGCTGLTGYNDGNIPSYWRRERMTG